jgi:hypothetical protein
VNSLIAFILKIGSGGTGVIDLFVSSNIIKISWSDVGSFRWKASRTVCEE